MYDILRSKPHLCPACQLNLAGKAPAGLVLGDGDVAVDGGVQLTAEELHAALAAHAIAGAGGVDGDVGKAGGVQQLVAHIGGDGDGLAAGDMEGNVSHNKILSM